MARSLYHSATPPMHPLPRLPSRHHPHSIPSPPGALSPAAPAPMPFYHTDDMDPGAIMDAFDTSETAALPTSCLTSLPWSTPLSAWSISPSPSPTGFRDADRSLEREICSNFTCCGLALADLHELLDHFEESHVFVLNNSSQADTASFPSATDPSHASHGRASVVVGYPQPRPLPSRAQTPPTAPHSARSSPSPASPVAILSAHIPSRTAEPRASDAPASTQAADILALPPASFSIPPASGPIRTLHDPDRRGAGGRFQPIYGETSLVSASRRPKHSPGRKREKMYHCPRPHCTKSYLNPNGLKYHIEKGTCTLDTVCSA